MTQQRNPESRRIIADAEPEDVWHPQASRHELECITEEYLKLLMRELLTRPMPEEEEES